MTEAEKRLGDLLASLTPVQRHAAGWGDGAFLLLAGPGSGKTRVLTARISKLLVESPQSRWRILALTFTNRAADEMRSRILEIIPDAEDRLFIGTFHSFACEVLRQSGSLIGLKTDFKIYSSMSDRLLMLNRALSVADVNPEIPREKILPMLDRLRDLLVSPDESERFFSSELQGIAISQAYKAYDDFLTTENAVDFPALIYKAHALFKVFPTVARKYSSNYKYLCLDEFQDANEGQYKLLRAFASTDYKNVFAVADDDQIIYQWNGASHQRLEQFQSDFDPERFQMPTNFRCPASVVQLANNLVTHNRLRAPGKSPLEVGRTDTAVAEEVRVLSFATDTDEAREIARDIASRHRAHLGSVALIARTKALLEKAREALHDEGIPAQIAQRRDSFASLPYAWLQGALNLANRRSDQRAFQVFAEASNKLLSLDIDLDSASAQASATHGDLLRSWATEAAQSTQLTLPGRAIVEAINSQLAERLDYRKFIRIIVSHFQEQKEVFEREYPLFDEDRRAWTELSKEIASSSGAGAGLDSFLQELEMRSKEPPLMNGVLPLLTIHGSKGNEFDHVYIVGLAEDILPSFQSKNKGNASPEMEEERRNCFVAITRCMKSLTLSYAGRYRGYAKSPSRFLTEMEVVSTS
ncbi:DNA/RNA helicase, superfamily I [Polaromonas sp. CF318]|uniref:ATP-dependent helicase n=1 Tax=Polaromonas sp. CF318 TaxID=1144318 RepID=UPI00027126D4|nr:ATP-dependent helicase [Polaromonas sp. CF318]EJL81522.1 DNA/RNA helicase, superfamily I [Polaromonas sp. CF318]